MHLDTPDERPAHSNSLPTYRVYVRWPAQKVSERTVTQDRAIADQAFKQLALRKDSLRSAGAYGIAFTVGGERIEYLLLNAAPIYGPRRPRERR